MLVSVITSEKPENKGNASPKWTAEALWASPYLHDDHNEFMNYYENWMFTFIHTPGLNIVSLTTKEVLQSIKLCNIPVPTVEPRETKKMNANDRRQVLRKLLG